MRTSRTIVILSFIIGSSSCGTPVDQTPQPQQQNIEQNQARVSSYTVQSCGNYHVVDLGGGKYRLTTNAEKTKAAACCIKNDNEPLTDPCGNPYEETLIYFMGFEVKSNGACTGTTEGSGAYQCVMLIKNFYVQVFKRPEWGTSWIDVAHALTKITEDDKNNAKDPVFVFQTTSPGFEGTAEALRVGDAIFYGVHTVLVSEITARNVDGSKIEFNIIEQNVMTDESCDNNYRRKMYIQWDKDLSRYRLYQAIDNKELKPYHGFLRHNMSGLLSSGWNVDISQKFRDAYKTAHDSDDKKIGWAFDNGGGPFVHYVRGYQTQDFISTNPTNRYGTDGMSMIVYNPSLNQAFHLRENAYGVYKCMKGSDGQRMGGLELLGAPTSKQSSGDKINSNTCELDTNGLTADIFQKFDNGCIWRRTGETVIRVHTFDKRKFDEKDMLEHCKIDAKNNPPGTECQNECSDGAQQCADATHLNVCARPSLTDICNHWVNMACGSGLVCQNNACVAPPMSEFCSPNGDSRRCHQYSEGTGICIDNRQICHDGEWGKCTGGIPPAQEICGNGIDEDCNGTDLSCPPPSSVDIECTNNNSKAACWTYPNVGICHDATKTCVNGRYTACQDGQGPIQEICGNGIDEDCNGTDLVCPATDAAPQKEPATEPQLEPAIEPGIEPQIEPQVEPGRETGPEKQPEPINEPGPEPQRDAALTTPDTATYTPPTVVIDANGNTSTGGIIGTGGTNSTGGIVSTGGVVGTGGANTLGGTTGNDASVNSYDIFILEDATTIIIAVRLRNLSISKKDVCFSGNAPGMSWNGPMLVAESDGLARFTIAKSMMKNGTPFTDCVGNPLPYRFSLRNCNENAWADLNEYNAGPLWWWGRDDRPGSDGKCVCTGGLAFALNQSGNLIMGESYRKNCY